MSSLWSENTVLPAFPALEGDVSTDVLIIGGGMAGLLCALLLKQQGVSCVVAEASRICSGATKNTTAKITSHHGLIYSRLLREKGEEKARMYLTANETALETFRSLRTNWDCDFEEASNFVYSSGSRQTLEAETLALQRLGIDAQFHETIPLPFSASAVEFPHQAQFHPLRFVNAFVQELQIFENTPVRAIEGHTAICSKGRIHAKAIIVATHFPFLNKHGSYFLKLYQQRSYVLALSGVEAPKGMFIGDTENSYSFRRAEGLLLFGGGGHRTGKPGGNWELLRKNAAKWYPSAREEYAWSAQDCISLDGLPYIGLYSRRTPELYVATGFNKWGMTSSMAAAILLRDQICGKKNDWAPIFDPSRSMLKPQLFSNVWEASKNLLTPSPKRCPHMGCALKWNKAEHSWDCPCHGSRFSEKGALIDNPAVKNLKTRS